MDTNANNEVDQFRWLNTAGTRWGVDTDGDRKIDVWKMISAEEATREAILALASKDERRLLAVMLTPEDLKSLGLASEPASRLAANIKDAPQRFRTVLSLSKIITPKTQWVRFDCSMLMPSLIPAEPGKTRNDLTVYENVMAIVDNGGENGFVQVGEMVRVGQAWKLTQVPQPMEGEKFELAEGGILLQPAAMGAATAAEGLSPKLKELLDQLRELDAKAPQAQAKLEDITKYNVARAQLLALLTDESPSDEEKLMWQRQRLEGIAAATQMKTYPNGVEELKRSEQALRRAKVDENLVAFAVFQRLLAEYNLQLETATSQEDRGKLQESWLKSLEGFVSEFPKAPESADAMLQLAITYEFNGNLPQASSWYNKLATGYPKSAAAARAQGALRRLDLKGKPLKLSGASLAGGSTIDMAAYRGKVVAVIFWATWCTPCTQDLPQIQQLHKTYQKDGFEVLGVNLDGPGAPIQQYLQNFKVTWPHIHEEGGLESRPAVEFGVISLPTMFLIDRSGLVVSPSLSTEELVKQVPELLKK
jgi:thiol-disulfide isomerase/thioredoxin